MHRAAKLQFERIAHEFARWRLVPGVERSPAPAWWWGPAIEVRGEPDAMSAEICASLDLRPNSSHASGAAVLMNSLADQKLLPYAGEFPRKLGI